MRALFILAVLSFPAAEVWSATTDGRMSADAGGILLAFFGALVVAAALWEGATK